ncbi:zinc finger BED domain-containing protein RICESLEEPER 2-like [Senna tora]|uniref:Zinc finger BED domain-containing protein RICESLEEPER 2-like n=1 Tax=Senna tora TaxID=362788 RepID=A0A834WLF6_9FABA|nr:zinc finger BED domain-containing protein RICESLEEPER 2-like [Senna tora]
MHCGKLMSALGGTSHLRLHLLTCPKRPSDLENEQHRTIEADEVALCLREWGIDNKIFSITLDNASYNDVMVNSMKQQLSINRTLLCDGALFQVRCCSNILNLIVHAGLKVADEAISKVRNGIKYVKKSVSRAKIFYDIAEKSYQLNTSKKLRLDVSVRWNSTSLMLDHAIYYKSVLEHWGRRDVAFKNFVLSEEE